MNLEGRSITEVQYDESTGDYYVIIPETILKNLDWEEGDVVEYEFDEYATAVYIRKVN
jgi:bifunctional DNA-binding transcriptional regulator/antitoxin component of YhaV-PrlF toxin-antitoxin module